MLKSQQELSFYNPTNLKSYNLDQTMRYQLNVLENLDRITRIHSENVANLTCRICEYLHASKSFTLLCTMSAYMHDIGKAFIPYEILTKPTRLTDEEYEVMKTHTTIGYNMCMKDPKLRPYAAGALYHHECLDGSGYPNGLTEKDIPYFAQIIHIADIYDAIVTKRQYTTHVNISETLRLLIKESEPSRQSIALDTLSTDSKVGKINGKVLNVLFKVVIDDTLYEISGTMEYVKYIKEQLKRLYKIRKFDEKSHNSKHKSEYYTEYMKLLFENGENAENYINVISEYEEALKDKEDLIQKLYKEINIIKQLKAR